MRILPGLVAMLALALAVAWAVAAPSPIPRATPAGGGVPAAPVVDATPSAVAARASIAPEPRRPVGAVEAGRGAVTGTIVDGDGAPVVGATVRATLCDRDEAPLRVLGVATTDARGRYRIRLDALASWSAIARSGLTIGVEAAPPGGACGDDCAVELESDARGVPFAVADLPIGPGLAAHVVRGRVVDAAGRPVGRADVRYREGGRAIVAEARSDGTFRLEIDDDERATTLDAFHPEVGVAGPVALALGAKPAAHDVVLRLGPRGAVLDGHVRFPDGSPARGVELELDRREHDLGARGYRGPPDGAVHAVVHTDAQGRFRAVGLALGSWGIEVPVEAFSASDGTAGEDLVAPVVHSTGTVPCEVVLASGRLSFEVVDADGRPVHAATLRFVEWDAGSWAERAAAALLQGRAPDAETLEWGFADERPLDAGGTAEIWLDPGDVVAWQVDAPGAVSVPGWTRMPALATDVRRRVVAATSGPTTGARVRVTGPGGGVVRPASVAAWRPWLPDYRVGLPLVARPGGTRAHVMPPDGFVPLTPGPWRLELHFDPDTFLLARVVDVDVPAGGRPAAVDFVARRGSRIAVRFLWVREQIGPDFSANFPCGHPFMTFEPAWRPERGEDVALDLREPSGEAIRSAPQPRAEPLDTVVACGLVPSAGTLRIGMSVFDAVELDTTLTEGWNRFEVRVDRRNRPFSIRRLSARR